MATVAAKELVDQFEEFYCRYYSEDVAELAREYPLESTSLELDRRDLYQMDPAWPTTTSAAPTSSKRPPIAATDWSIRSDV